MLRSVLLVAFGPLGWALAAADQPRPLKALLVAGGCCHDYKGQHQVLSAGIQARAFVRVDVVWTDDSSVDPPLPLYDRPDWAAGYDVVIHDECAAGNKDLRVLKHLLEAHRTVPAVHLHCAMHSFRNGTDQWFRHLGLQSSSHGPQEPIAISFVDREHPVTRSLEDWTTGKEELYNNVALFGAHPLALGRQTVKAKDGSTRQDSAVVAWTHEPEGAARSFSTSLGHNTVTVADDRYLDLVTRGLLWACGKLDVPGYLGTPFAGAPDVTFVPAKPKPKPQPAPAAGPGPAPKDAIPATASASSEETGKHNLVWHAIDGNPATRWCAANAEFPQWLRLEFERPVSLSGAKIAWESPNNAYAHRIEGSGDGQAWTVLADLTATPGAGDSAAVFPSPPPEVRFLKITCTGTSGGGWASIREIALAGPGFTKLHPKLDAKQQAAADRAADPFAQAGNIPPEIVRLSAEEETAALRDVKIPEGFEATLFSDWRAANYPVYVAAAPSGDLYVASDGNGSLGRNPGRGRVLRLRDADGDGRADQVTEFVPDLDSPRGLVWDLDRLYVLHPPDISVFHDRDGDGVAEASQTLVEGIAFGFADRPADHTTNGLELGIDGWLYVAGGDFGFLDAKGTDGRRLQHRGGGVIRVRPDGSGLELFATGTRNILGTPTSPLLDLFARDNTNDGGGWDVRFHHFTGLEDHGYPRLYKNFPAEHVAPLSDYGGGSGCGSLYLDEPGFPAEWNDAPLTCDWGSGALWKHSVARRGATFAETSPPQPFVRVTRPTDADADGLSRIYQASWKGPATFNWAGPEQGYIVRVRPKDFTPDPLPDFARLDDAALVALLESPSHVRRLTAQRTLVRREPTDATGNALAALAGNPAKPLKARVAALYAMTQRGLQGTDASATLERLVSLRADPALLPFVLRALGDLGPDRITAAQPGPVPADAFVAALAAEEPRVLVEAMVAAARQGTTGAADAIAARLGHADPVVAHTAFQALAKLGAADACFAVLDAPEAPVARREGAARALMRMHRRDVVDGLLARLASDSRPEVRRVLLAALCRLHHREAPWKGDSWGTRPDTRGPYYQPEPWEASPDIFAALQATLTSASAEEAAFLVTEMNRNRIQSDAALRKVIALASADDALVPEAVAQIAAAGEIPGDAVPILLRAARSAAAPPATLAQTVAALVSLDDRDALPAALAALARLDQAKGSGKEQEAGRNAFLNAPKLENHHLALVEHAAAAPDSPEGRWATAGWLALAARTSGSPESRETAAKAIDAAWPDPKRKMALMRAAADTKNNFLNARILVALADPDPAVAKAARDAAGRLKLEPQGSDPTPRIADLSPEQAVQAVVAARGDVALGEAVFTRATCANCHTVSQDAPQKGPYLGNIAQTYRRPDLATAILDPGKTIAQGFATHVITTKDGSSLMGFVTAETGDAVTLRDITAGEHRFPKADIAKRETVPVSMMPPGLMLGFTVREFASLLDYLEALAKAGS
jgi:putative membrane-bound dehydrogenase-like protein